MARYAHTWERVNANIACDNKVNRHAKVMNVTLRPVLSIMNPRIGEATAENKYGIPRIDSISFSQTKKNEY